MFRSCVVSAMLCCARASDVELGALGAALTDDDQCEAGSDCALKALQLKAVKDSSAVPSECTEGMVGMIRGMATDCIDTCPQMCGSLGEAVTAFLTKSADKTVVDAVEPIVCGAKNKFACAFNNLDKCNVLITQAAALGIALPKSKDAMDAQCNKINMIETKVRSEVEASQNSTRSICTEGLVGQIRAFSTSCIDSCPQMCGPMDQAVHAYLTKGGYPAVKPIVCAQQNAFRCALTGSNYQKCKPLIVKAASFGFRLPSSIGALRSQCHR